MKKFVFPFVIILVLLSACQSSGTATAPVATSPMAPTETQAATGIPTATPAPTATGSPHATQGTTPEVNATCNELALFLDPALATGFSCKTVQEVNGQNSPGFEVFPQNTELTLTGYVLSDRFFDPHITVYPVQRFSELLPDVISANVLALENILGGGSSGEHGLPLLPNLNASQEFYAQLKVLSFGGGNGIRYLTQYSQYFDPINNHELFYTFQGLTSDGKYWVSAILPISNPILPEDGNTPPNGQSQEEFSRNFPTYITDITSQLNAQSDGSYSPGIAALDALVASIRIQP